MTNGSEQHKRIHTIFQFFLCHVDPKCLSRVSQKTDKIATQTGTPKYISSTAQVFKFKIPGFFTIQETTA